VFAGLAALGSLGAEEDWEWEEIICEAGVWGLSCALLY
jgi:hypothetical protein